MFFRKEFFSVNFFRKKNLQFFFPYTKVAKQKKSQ